MKQWMTGELVVSRWVVLAIAALSIVSFSVLYAKAHELHSELHLTKAEQRRQTGIISCPPLNIPIVGTLGYPEMWIGFLCNLGIVIGAVCTLFHGRRSTEETESSPGPPQE